MLLEADGSKKTIEIFMYLLGGFSFAVAKAMFKISVI